MITASYPFPDARSATYADSLAGALYGTALGDAVGFPLELLSKAEISSAHSSITSLLSGSLEVSDDSQLALYTFDGLTEVLEWNNQGAAADEIACIWLALLRWYRGIGYDLPEEAPYSLDRPLDSFASLRHQRGPGKATLAALASGQMQLMHKNMNPQALGSGALVRSLCLGFLPVPDAGTVTGLASRQAALTHGHPEAIISACAYALLIRYTIAYRGSQAPLRSATEAVLEWLKGLPLPTLPEPEGATCLALETALASTEEGKKATDFTELFGNLWLAPAVLGIGVLTALEAEAQTTSNPDALAALERASFHDGDSDSTAAVCGALLGAAYGQTIFPAEILAKIDVADAIEYLLAQWKKELGI